MGIMALEHTRSHRSAKVFFDAGPLTPRPRTKTRANPTRHLKRSSSSQDRAPNPILLFTLPLSSCPFFARLNFLTSLSIISCVTFLFAGSESVLPA